MPVRLLPFVALFLSIAGCAAFQDCEYSCAQSFRSHKAWWCNPCERTSSIPWSHYSCGWRQGYRDVLMGGDGQCPPVPPPRYWSHKYQSCQGEAWIECWFSGYQDGANAAIALCEGGQHVVPFSHTFKQDCFDCLSSDMSPYPYGRTSLGLRPNRHKKDDDEYPPPPPTTESEEIQTTSDLTAP